MTALIRTGFFALGLTLIYSALYLFMGPMMWAHVATSVLVAIYMGVWILMIGGVVALVMGFSWRQL